MRLKSLCQNARTCSTAALLVLASIAATSASPSQESVVKVEKPKLHLPMKHIDEQLRVAVVFASNNQDSNPTFRSYFHGELLHSDKMVEIDITPSLVEITSEVTRTLFPHTSTYTYRGSTSQGMYDLLLLVSSSGYTRTMESSLDTPSNVLMYLEVHLEVTILDSDGKELDKISLVQAEKPTHSITWSNKTRATGMARRILLKLAPRLQRALATSAAIKTYLAKVAVKRAKECQLFLEASFNDSESLIPNGELDAAEQAKLIVHVENRGPGPAFGVSLFLQGDLAGMTYSPSYPLGNLEVGETRRVEVPLLAPASLKTQRSYLQITAKEQRRFDSPTVQIPIEQKELVPPKLQIPRLECVKSPTCEQYGNQIVVATGGVLAANLWVQNTGPGEAKDITLSASSLPESLSLLGRPDKIDALPAGSAKPLEIRLRTGRYITEPSLNIQFTVHDGRSDRFAATYRATWSVKQRKPILRADMKIFENGELGSSGNGDGFLSNGEKGVVEVSIRNDGDLDAEDIQLEVSCCRERRLLEPQQFNIQRIASLGRARPLYFELELPWDFTELDADKIFLRQSIGHAGFPTRESEPSLRYRSLQPSLKLDAPTTIEIQQGTKTDLLIGIRNAGTLPAKEVEVGVSLVADGVDLVSPDGVRKQETVLTVGTVDSESAGQTLPLALGARGGAKAGDASAKIRVSQAHFPAVEYTIPITVLERKYELQLKDDSARASSGDVMIRSKPIVIFDRPREGDLVTHPEIAVRFSVYSEAAARLMTLTQNGRELDVSAVQSVGKRGNRLLYEIRAHLSPGKNTFSATAVDELGVVGESSVTASLTLREAGSTDDTSRRSIVLDVTQGLLDALGGEGEFRVNGQDVVVRPLGDGTAEFTSLGGGDPVEPGINRANISIKGVNHYLLMLRYQMSLDLFPDQYRSSFAILAAIDDYDRTGDGKRRGPTGSSPLQGMVDGAKRLKRRLMEVGFPESNIFTLYDSEATATALGELLREFWAGGRYEGADRLFFYFGGHGKHEGGQGYLVTYDIDPSRPAASSFLMSDIYYRHFPLADVHHFFVTIDACASGLTIPGAKPLGGDDVEALKRYHRLSVFRGDMTGKARQVLVAGTRDQEALSTSSGIFTRALIRGLGGGADLNGDSIVQAQELGVFVKNEVVAKTGNLQKPSFKEFDEFGSGSVIFLLPGRERLSEGRLR